MNPAPDPLAQLEHDHQHLNRVVASIRESIADALRGDHDLVTLRDEFAEFIELVREELYSHFDREETGLFPYIGEILPDLRPNLDSLSVAHDRICGVAARLERAVDQDQAAFEAGFDGVVALFARFDANYARHARDEQELIRSLAGRLTLEQRRAVAQHLADI